MRYTLRIGLPGDVRLRSPLSCQTRSRLPGAVAHIPDPNLRAAIAEVLGKSPNAPITVEEMERIERRLEVQNRGIQDLTGLQFATNLDRLYLRDNQISDISPLAGLINLQRLGLEDNPVFDLSPLRGLNNLTQLVVLSHSGI